jgi:hypothetical protein
MSSGGNYDLTVYLVNIKKIQFFSGHTDQFLIYTFLRLILKGGGLSLFIYVVTCLYAKEDERSCSNEVNCIIFWKGALR